jgi:predicted Rossmann-fold nucleotide-binding protein
VHFPVVLFGSAYWQGLLDWIRDPVLKEAKISPDDLDLMIVTDDVDEAVQAARLYFERKSQGTPPKKRARPRKSDAQ